MPNFDIVQVAYFVTDIREAAADMTKTFGAGPFYILDNIRLASGEHRGEPCDFVHSSAYGQWGDLMMELVQQQSIGPSPFRDLFQPGETGLHHVATMVDDLPNAFAAYRESGFEVATRATTLTGTEFAFIDATQTLGHFIEIYERSPTLLAFYDMVREASIDWQGEQPIRAL